MRIVWIIKLERSRRTAAIVAVRAPAVHGVSSLVIRGIVFHLGIV